MLTISKFKNVKIETLVFDQKPLNFMTAKITRHTLLKIELRAHLNESSIAKNRITKIHSKVDFYTGGRGLFSIYSHFSKNVQIHNPSLYYYYSLHL